MSISSQRLRHRSNIAAHRRIVQYVSHQKPAEFLCEHSCFDVWLTTRRDRDDWRASPSECSREATTAARKRLPILNGGPFTRSV
jgi:hypothetical protein